MSEVFKWFGDAGNAAFVASLLSVTAIIVSILAFRKSLKTQKRLVDIEDAREKDRLAEKKKANLTARIMREPGTRNMRDLLVIENSGHGEARNIKIILANKPILEHPAVLQGTDEVTKVGPNSHIQYLLALCMGNYPPFDIEILWEDDSGESGKYSTTLTL